MDLKQLDALYIYLSSEQTSQEYLLHCYQKLTDVDAKKKSYQNGRALMYYLDHGRTFYHNGQQATPLLQPILYFYGMVHLLKAVLLTKRPEYPESTSMLAHGVSTRKRKKKNYNFINDEVKVQHKGLFPYFSEHLFAIKPIPFEKITMHRLFGLIPELTPLFHFHGEVPLIKVGTLGANHLTFPSHILDDYHLTERAFIKWTTPYLAAVSTTKSTKQTIQFKLHQPFIEERGPFFIHQNESIYFPTARENMMDLAEVMIHYLLLYNLSMISRYETEWWGDLLAIKPELDYPLILKFLQITAQKVPLLLGNELLKQY